MQKFAAALLLLLFSTVSMAQQSKLTGRVLDEETGKPFRGATISLLAGADSSLLRFDIADGEGKFLMPGLSAGSYILTVSAAGYRQYAGFFKMEGQDKDFTEIKLFKKDKTLTEVTIVAKMPPVIQNGDTTQYNADRFKVNPDANAEELIKKMPGISVDKTGTVTAMGEQVKNVTVDGKRYFGDDVTAALRNLPADIIDKIQVFDRLSEQSQFTGFDDGSGAKGMNIVTRSGMRNGQFGRVYAGYGTDSRYNAGGNVSFFKGDRRISLAGLFNNINQQNFSSEDLFGVTGSGGGRTGGGGNRGGGRMGGGGFGGGMGGNFLVGQQNGISDTKSSGINYSDKWGEKTEVSGSYFFNHGNTNNDQLSNTQYFISDSTDQFYGEQEMSASANTNHRFNFRIDHKFDSSHSILFTPSLSYQENNSDNEVNGTRTLKGGIPMSSNDYIRSAQTKGYNTNNNLMYRYAFPKKGRTFSVNVGFGGNTKDGEIFLSSHNLYQTGPVTRVDSVRQRTDQQVEGINYSASLSYTEPVGKSGQLQLTYTPGVSNTNSDQIVYAFDTLSVKYDRLDTGLSNKFVNRIETHTAGLSFRKGDRDNMLNFGLNFRYTDMNSDQDYPVLFGVSKSFRNLLPNLMWRKKMSASKNINVYYRANANTPSVSQLQNVVDNSNSLLLSTGNPDLRQQVNHTLGSRYSLTNAAKATSFFASIFTQVSEDYIATATYTARRDSVLTDDVVLHPGSQLSKPVNLQGYANIRMFLTYGLPVKKLKSNLNLNGGVTWSRLPGLVNGLEGRSDNYTVNAGAVFSSNISQYVDFTLSYSGAFSTANNTISPDLNSKYVNNTFGAQCNLLSKKGWFFNTDLTGQYYSGLSEGFDQGFWLWNAGAGKKFLKNQAGEIKFSVFDILKQNQSITRTVTETSIEDVRNTVLRRYFMITFSYRLRNFGTPPKNQNKDREWGMPPGGPGFPGGPPPGKMSW